jgi:hypothetical protein
MWRMRIVGLTLALAMIAGGTTATERLRAIAVTTTDAQVRLYSSSDGAATGSRPKAGFPDHVYVLEESGTGRLRIRFPDTGETAWVRGRDVRVTDLPARTIECDPVTRPSPGQTASLTAQATRGARGAGVGECR